MAATAMSGKDFFVDIEEKNGMFFGTSEEIKGLFIAKHTLDEVVNAIAPAVQDLYKACGLPVVVCKIESADNDRPRERWVYIPGAIAQAGLDRFSSEAA